MRSRPGHRHPGAAEAGARLLRREILAITQVRVLLAAAARPVPRRVARDWRTCSRYCRTKASSTGGPLAVGAFEQFRARWRPPARRHCQQIDTSALPSSTPPGPRPDADRPQWPACPFGRDAAHAECSTLPPGGQTDLAAASCGLSIVPAAVSERDVHRPAGSRPPPRDLLADKFNASVRRVPAARAPRAGPAHQPAQTPAILQESSPSAQRIETTFKRSPPMELARHARIPSGLLAHSRTIAAHTLMRLPRRTVINPHNAPEAVNSAEVAAAVLADAADVGFVGGPTCRRGCAPSRSAGTC